MSCGCYCIVGQWPFKGIRSCWGEHKGNVQWTVTKHKYTHNIFNIEPESKDFIQEIQVMFGDYILINWERIFEKWGKTWGHKFEIFGEKVILN